MPDVMTWLRAGVPLTLVIDLLDPAGPDSTRIYADECSEPADPWWTAAVVGNVAAQLTASGNAGLPVVPRTGPKTQR